MDNARGKVKGKVGTPYAKICFFCVHCTSKEHLNSYCEVRDKEVAHIDDCQGFTLDDYYTQKENAYDSCSNTMH